jgi:antirestriction protein ArdC
MVNLSRKLATSVKNDSRAIFTAAAHAQRAADYLLGLQRQEPTGSAG